MFIFVSLSYIWYKEVMEYLSGCQEPGLYSLTNTNELIIKRFKIYQYVIWYIHLFGLKVILSVVLWSVDFTKSEWQYQQSRRLICGKH